MLKAFSLFAIGCALFLSGSFLMNHLAHSLPIALAVAIGSLFIFAGAYGACKAFGLFD